MSIGDPARAADQPPRMSFFGLNRWLQVFLTIIAGTVVAIIAWDIIQRFMHILVLLLGSLLLAYLLGPIVDRLGRAGLNRLLSILVVYLALLGGLTLGIVLLVGPLSAQITGLANALPGWADPNTGIPAQIADFARKNGIPVDVRGMLNNAADYLSGQATSLLGGTLAVVAGLVAFVTDLFLGLAIAFYFLLDGSSMRTRALRLLPAGVREKWFFVEATLTEVVGGYIRGQIVVALTVGIAAGLGSAVLGVQYPLVIGLLAFVFEFIPMLGPVLGMVPAVIIAFFQSPTLALWTIVYFIILQQVESNVIVPRISGHAVGLHPLAALLALLAGFELGGVGGALLAVPIMGVLFVLALAIYADVSGETELLITRPQTTAYRSLRNAVRSRGVGGQRVVKGEIAPSAPNPVHTVPATSTVPVSHTHTPAEAPAALEKAPRDRLATIAHEQAELKAQFEQSELEAEVEAAAESAGTETEEPKSVDGVAPQSPELADKAEGVRTGR